MWEDALLLLHSQGWGTDDIDSACEAIRESRSEGSLPGTELAGSTAEQVNRVLGVSLSTGERLALLVVAEVQERDDAESHALRQALYDLDAFAYARGG